MRINYLPYDPDRQAEFLAETFREAFPGYSPDEAVRCIELLAAAKLECTVALAEDVPAGFLVYKRFPRFCYCEYIAVKKEFRGMGIARGMLDHTCGGGKQWIFEIETTGDREEFLSRHRLFSDAGFQPAPFNYTMPRGEEVAPGSEFDLWSRYTMDFDEFQEVCKVLETDPGF